MNKMTTRAVLLAAAFIVSIPLGLMAQDEGFYPYSFARLTYVNGDVYVQRTSDLGYEKGEVNLALVQGDKMGTENGQAEIHFGRRNYLRLDNRTKVEFAVLPTEGDERIRLYLTDGSAYLRISQLALDKGVEVHTPDASFYVLEEGLYRFDVRLDRETQASVREGSLEAASESGSVVVGYQETVTVSEGRLLGEPEYAYARDDAFDGWNGSRDGQLSARSDSRYLPTEMAEYEEELDQNGQWVYERPYGHVWVPNVSYYDTWRPYYYGRWVWYPVIGWTWVSSEPWGWAVYHYGRWNWRFGLGWYWIPRPHWGPAWVHWWYDRAYVGWCPLTWYNRPGYLFNDRFYDRYDDRWFSARNRAWTVVRRDHLQARDIGRRHLGAADLDRIGRVELRPQQPAIRPAMDNARPQAVAARRVLADRPGSRGQVRNVAPSRSLASPRSRPGASSPAVRTRDVGASPSVRSYPSRRAPGGRDSSGLVENRRSVVASPGRASDAGRGTGSSRVVTRAPERPAASSERRSASAREAPGTRGSGSPVARKGEAVKSYPSTVRSNTGTASRAATSTARAIRSTSARSASPSSGRSQSRTYAPSPSVAGQTSRLSSRATTAPGRSSSVSRSASSPSRAITSRTPSSSRLRTTSPSSGSRSARSYSSPSRPARSSGRSYAAPRSSSPSSSRAISAPRSTRSAAPRSVSAPRSSRSSSGRASGSVRSGGSSSSRAKSSSRSSASASKSGGAKKK